MTAASKLIHLVEIFSAPWFLFANETNYTLVIFLLGMLNNLVQYQFDGNFNLAYTMIRKRDVFYQLANLPTNLDFIQSHLSKRCKKILTRKSSQIEEEPMEGSQPAKPAEPGILRASLMSLPRIESFTEDVNAYQSQRQFDQITPTLNSQTDIKTMELEGRDEEHSERDANKVDEVGASKTNDWNPLSDWVRSWKNKMPMQTIMRMLQVLQIRLHSPSLSFRCWSLK